MANVVKYKKTGDMEMQGGILLNPLTASNVPNAGSGQKTLFLDVADTTLKTKDSSGTVASIGGGAGASAPVAVTSGTLNITSSHNGKLITNAGATGNIILSLDSVANLGNTFEIGVANKGGGYGGIDSYTKLMLHMNGSNNGTTFTDSSASAHTVTRTNAVTKTETKKFGTASGYFDGEDDFLSIPDSEDFNFSSGDFTIDLWLYHTGAGNTYQGIISNDDGTTTSSWNLHYNQSGNNITFAIRTVINVDSGTLTLNQWNHIAVVCSSGSCKIAINGTFGVAKSIGTLYYYDQGIKVGKMYFDATPDREITGYIDELRISKGIARWWTSNFTPLTREYENVAQKITITPITANQLPGTEAAGNSIQSGSKDDYIKLRSTDSGWICTGVYPDAANWVDLLD